MFRQYTVETYLVNNVVPVVDSAVLAGYQTQLGLPAGQNGPQSRELIVCFLLQGIETVLNNDVNFDKLCEITQ